jgi:hypothetical protein
VIASTAMPPILSCDAYGPGDVMHGIRRPPFRADLSKSPATLGVAIHGCLQANMKQVDAL